MSGAYRQLMRAGEIHYYLLSLLVRGLGFWLLFSASTAFESFGDSLYSFAFRVNPGNPETFLEVIGTIYGLIIKLIPAVYLIAGAPPFLKMATEEKYVARD